MLLNGSAKAQARVLNEKNLAPLNSNTPPSSPADLTKVFTINQTDPVVWVVDKYPYSEPQVPVIYGNSSDGWTANTTIHMPYNATIDVVMQIANDSMDVMGHPMHLHGHKFWVLGSGSGPFPYSSVDDAPRSAINLQNPPYRDTVELPASGWVVIRYITDNPGGWLFHCHIQWHLVSGMALVLVEGDDLLPGIVSAPRNITTPGVSQPSVTSSSGTDQLTPRGGGMLLAVAMLYILLV